MMGMSFLILSSDVTTFKNKGEFLLKICVGVNTNIIVAILNLLANYILFCDHANLVASMLPLLFKCCNSYIWDEFLLLCLLAVVADNI